MTNDDAVRRRKEQAEQMNEPAAAATGSDQSRLRPAGQTPAASSWKTRGEEFLRRDQGEWPGGGTKPTTHSHLQPGPTLVSGQCQKLRTEFIPD